MKRMKYTTEFNEEAVKQVIDKGHAVPDVQGCGVSRTKPKRVPRQHAIAVLLQLTQQLFDSNIFRNSHLR